MVDPLAELLAEIIRFRDARDWAQFHTVRNLASALSIEASELQDVLLWKTDDEIAKLSSDSAFLERLSNEVADVMIYALLICERIDVEPRDIIKAKLILNEKNYPVSAAKGNAIKHRDRTKPRQ